MSETKKKKERTIQVKIGNQAARYVFMDVQCSAVQ